MCLRTGTLRNIFCILSFVTLVRDEPIVGGVPVKDKTKFPYVVSLRNVNTHFSGGSILNRRWIITVAHGLIGQFGTDKELAKTRLSIFAGTLRRSRDSTEKIFLMEDYFLRKDYKHEHYYLTDIALIRVTSDIIFNNFIRSIPIDRSNSLKPGDVVTAAGWGLTKPKGIMAKVLQTIKLTVIDLQKCKAQRSFIDEHNMCTEDRPNYGTLKYDSGGPIVSENGDLVGIISFYIPFTGQRANMEVQTRVFYYRDWIDSYIQNDS